MTASVLSHNSAEPSLNNDPNAEESSDFVVLNHYSPTEEFLNGNENYFDRLQISLESITTDLTPDEIQSRLKELLQENIELKEVLTQNNKKMKEQFATLVQFQEQIRNATEYHTQMYEESQALVENLRKEKFEALDNIQELETVVSTTQKKYEEVYSENQALHKENSDLKTEIDQIKTVLNNTKDYIKELAANLENAETKLKVLEEENAKLVQSRSDMISVQELDENGYSYVQMIPKESVGVQAESLTSNTRLTDEQLEEEKGRNALLTVELNEKELEIQQLKEHCQENDAKIIQMENKLAILTASNYTETSRESHESSQRELLNSEIFCLKQELFQIKHSHESSLKKVEEGQKEFDSLLKEYGKALNVIEELQGKCRSNQTQSDSRNLQIELDNVIAQLYDKEQELGMRLTEIDHLKMKNTEMERKLERLPIVEAQSQVYEEDFKKAEDEKIKYRKELASLKACLGALREQNEELLEQHLSSPNRRRHRGNTDATENFGPSGSFRPLNNSPTSATNSDRALYNCPFCNFGFTTPDACSNHVMNCGQ